MQVHFSGGSSFNLIKTVFSEAEGNLICTYYIRANVWSWFYRQMCLIARFLAWFWEFQTNDAFRVISLPWKKNVSSQGLFDYQNNVSFTLCFCQFSWEILLFLLVWAIMIIMLCNTCNNPQPGEIYWVILQSQYVFFFCRSIVQNHLIYFIECNIYMTDMVCLGWRFQSWLFQKLR